MSDTDKISPKKPKWPRVLLVVSLGLNLMFVGLIAGAVLRGGPPEHRLVDRNVSALGLRPYFHALESDDKQALQAAIRDNQDGFQIGRKLFRQHLKALAEAVRATPYDAGKVADVLNGQKDTVGNNMGVGFDMLLDRISAMSDGERAKFAEGLEKPPSRRGKPNKN